MSTSSTSGGWNRPSAAPKPPAKKPGSLKGALAGLLIVAALGAACWLMFSGDDAAESPREKNAKSIKTAKPAKAAKETAKEDSLGTKPDRRDEGVQSSPASVASVTDEKKDEATNKVEQVKRKKSPLRSRMERVINMVIPQRAGERLPPVPLDPDASTEEEAMEEIADIERGLANKLEVKEDDTPEEAAWKEAMTAVKEDFRAYMKKGYTFNQYIRALQDKFHADADFYSDAQELVSNSYDDKGLSDEDYRKVKEKIDKLLEERGLPQTEDDETLAQKEAEENATAVEKGKK